MFLVPVLTTSRRIKASAGGKSKEVKLIRQYSARLLANTCKMKEKQLFKECAKGEVDALSKSTCQSNSLLLTDYEGFIEKLRKADNWIAQQILRDNEMHLQRRPCCSCSIEYLLIRNLPR